jgi:hypothetical protein
VDQVDASHRLKPFAFLDGDPAKPGIYVQRVKFPPNVFTRPHWHGEDRHIVVLKGTWYMGTGKDFDASKAVPMPVGSYVKHPAGAVHWDGAKDEERTYPVLRPARTLPARGSVKTYSSVCRRSAWQKATRFRFALAFPSAGIDDADVETRLLEAPGEQVGSAAIPVERGVAPVGDRIAGGDGCTAGLGAFHIDAGEDRARDEQARLAQRGGLDLVVGGEPVRHIGEVVIGRRGGLVEKIDLTATRSKARALRSIGSLSSVSFAGIVVSPLPPNRPTLPGTIPPRSSTSATRTAPIRSRPGSSRSRDAGEAGRRR